MKYLHSEVTVRDLERSTRLYGDLVGMAFQVTSQTRPERGGGPRARGLARYLAHGQHAVRHVEDDRLAPGRHAMRDVEDR